MHNAFSKNVGPSSKFVAPVRWHDASSNSGSQLTTKLAPWSRVLREKLTGSQLVKYILWNHVRRNPAPVHILTESDLSSVLYSARVTWRTFFTPRKKKRMNCAEPAEVQNLISWDLCSPWIRHSFLSGILYLFDRTSLYSEINPTRCNNCVYSSKWLYSTCFGWQMGGIVTRNM